MTHTAILEQERAWVDTQHDRLKVLYEAQQQQAWLTSLYQALKEAHDAARQALSELEAEIQRDVSLPASLDPEMRQELAETRAMFQSFKRPSVFFFLAFLQRLDVAPRDIEQHLGGLQPHHMQALRGMLGGLNTLPGQHAMPEHKGMFWKHVGLFVAGATANQLAFHGVPPWVPFVGKPATPPAQLGAGG